MPIGAIVPGSNVDVTPDPSPSYYTTVQAPSPTQLVVAADIQALTLVVLNVQEKLRKYAEDPTYTNTHTATWDDGSTALFKFGSQSTYELGASVKYEEGAQITHEDGALENYEDGSITTFEPNSFLHLDGTTYVTGLVNYNDGAVAAFYDGSKLWVGTDTPVVGTDAEVIFRRYSTFTMAGVVTVEGTAVTTHEDGSVQVFNDNAQQTHLSGSVTTFEPGAIINQQSETNQTGVINCSGNGRVRKRVITGANADHTYTIADADIIEIPNQSATHTYFIATTGAAKGDELTLTMASLAHTLSSNGINVQRPDTTTIGYGMVKSSGSVIWMDLLFDGTNWNMARYGGYD